MIIIIYDQERNIFIVEKPDENKSYFYSQDQKALFESDIGPDASMYLTEAGW